MRRDFLLVAVLSIVVAGCPVTLARRVLMAGGGSGSFVAPSSTTVYTLSSAPEGGWTFQGNPSVIGSGGYTYIGYIDNVGSVKVAVASEQIIVATRTLHATLEVDDHDNPSLEVRTDGKLHVVYSKHVGPNIYERISTSTLASDPTLAAGFAAEASLSSTFGASQSTYPSLVRLSAPDGGASKLFLFWREVAGANQEWWYNAHDGSAWTGTTNLHSLTYSKITGNGTGRIDVAASDHPLDGAAVITHTYRESAAWHESDGTTISATMPFAAGDMTTVYTASGSDLVWILDIAINGSGNPVIVFVRYPSGSTSDMRYMYARWTGSAWSVTEICAAGGYIPDTAVGANPLEVYYPGGAELNKDDPTIIYASREVSGQWEMFRYVTANGGTSFTSTQITSGSSAKQIHPVGVRDQTGLAVVWDYGTFHSYVDYSLGMKGLAP